MLHIITYFNRKRKKKNENEFTAVRREIHDNLIEEDNEKENEISESTNRICSLQKNRNSVE